MEYVMAQAGLKTNHRAWCFYLFINNRGRIGFLRINILGGCIDISLINNLGCISYKKFHDFLFINGFGFEDFLISNKVISSKSEIPSRTTLSPVNLNKIYDVCYQKTKELLKS
ncbi:unnamed protein product [Rotaria sp. Silwood1]|nr:unnamed protein product [Rotaria sp. Silwood1]CAF3648485.1 unnamed protein product [Rotaria sp. Silwood1]CAF4959543.1 unnamed protein product [Rotaria sp. Silwood1]